MLKGTLLLFLMTFVRLTISQECDPEVVDWLPNPFSCTTYFICFHGNAIERSCAPNLHFSDAIRKCTFPEEARCDVNYMCPANDDVENPVLVPNTEDCQRYYVCFNGSPIERHCAEGLWWDVDNQWCETAERVKCDDRTIFNPDNPNTTPATTTTSTTTVITEPPMISTCYRMSHLFNPENGDYMKSFCVVDQYLTYDQSEEACQDLNMNLFVIDSTAVQSEFFTETTIELYDWAVGLLWINGRRDGAGEWFTFNPNRLPIYSGLDWVQTDTVDGRTSGDCLRYSEEHGHYQPKGENCDRTSFASCEFFQPPPLNTNICWAEGSLVDESGNYLKTSCIVAVARSNRAAEKTCRDNGMSLFVINNSTVQTAFFTSTTELLVAQQRGFVWINGNRDELGDWFSFGPMRRPIYDGLDWLNTESIDGRTSGDCLLYTSEYGPYQAAGSVCERAAWSICEY